jgi:E3 ubiquitin-protein ligase EDD1
MFCLHVLIDIFVCSIDVCAEEGGGSVELVPGGRDLEVTSANVYDYVRKYAEFRMLRAQEKALEENMC